MPFKSEAQRKYFHWAESKGILPKGISDEWEAETPKGKLPARIGKKKKRIKRANENLIDYLSDLASDGNILAEMIVSTVKKATVGRHEGYGATNSMVTAGSNLLSPSSLAKPPEGPKPQFLPNSTSASIGKTPSSLMSAGPVNPAAMQQATRPMAGVPATGVTAPTPPR